MLSDVFSDPCSGRKVVSGDLLCSCIGGCCIGVSTGGLCKVEKERLANAITKNIGSLLRSFIECLMLGQNNAAQTFMTTFVQSNCLYM